MVTRLEDSLPDVYYELEQNHLKPCSVQVNEQKLLFCLQPHASLPKEEAKKCASNLSQRRECSNGKFHGAVVLISGHIGAEL
eukprot:Skav236664  [mRNA]  locus=scaffold338:124827:129243:- [translate_table: standard]